MDSVHHIWCPLSCQEFQVLPDGAGKTLTFSQTCSTSIDENFRLITLNFRGHGGSNLGPVSELSISNFADDVMARVEHLAA